MSEITLEGLPDLTLVDEDYATHLARLKSDYQTATGVYPRPTYPETFLLEQFAYETVLVRQYVNSEGRQNLLAYATGDRLEHLGALLDVARLEATAAIVTLAFTLAGGHPATTMPAGTEVRAADGETAFRTDAATIVAAGVTSAEARATCTAAGPTGNGFQAGEVSSLVDVVPYVLGAVNVGVTLGGADAETDARYRERIHLAPAKFSVAGSEESYVYHTLSSHPGIVDVSVWGLPEAPGEVHVSALLTGGEAPTPEVVEVILAAISADRVRPLTDQVIWDDPDPVEYSITVELQVHASHAALAEGSRATAQARLEALAAAWRQRLGRDIVPEAIVERCQGLAGVYRTVVAAPTYTRCGRAQHPVCTGVVVTASVIEEAP
jgi:phage-related baseplate assembly protein